MTITENGKNALLANAVTAILTHWGLSVHRPWYC